jgi:hypothetical protein
MGRGLAGRGTERGTAGLLLLQINYTV